MTPEETAARVRDLVSRHQLCKRELAQTLADNDRLRLELQTRPTRAQYETLAKRCDQLETQYERQRAKLHETLRRNGDLRQTLERVRG